MRKIFDFILILTVFVLGLASCKNDSSDKLMIAASGWNKIAIIDKTSKQILWQYPLEKGWECNSIDLTPDGNILFSYSKGAKLISRDKKEIWNIPAPAHCEMQTASVLSDGNYLLAYCGTPAVIMEVSPEGEILKKIEYETEIENPHAQFRQIIKNKKGNYLMPLFATSEIREISPEGENIKITRLEGTPFTVLPNRNGYFWVSGGDAHSLIEYDFDNNNIIKRYGERDIKGVRFFFVAGLQESSKGNLYVCNWLGHADNATSAETSGLIEIDPKGKVVWNLNIPETAYGISCVREIQ